MLHIFLGIPYKQGLLLIFSNSLRHSGFIKIPILFKKYHLLKTIENINLKIRERIKTSKEAIEI
ncbi:MAG: hypothetical protein QXT38_03570 [Candidatus Aenigmatarchaeota archaeon]